MIRELILASASPARLQTLQRAGVAVRAVVSGIDEDAVRAADTASLVAELARRKAEAVFAAWPIGVDVALVGCDTLLDLDGRACGKPTDRAEAAEQWHLMRGRSGTLLTGHHLIVRRDGRTEASTRVASTRVEFAQLADDEIDAYVATGEADGAAGSFTIDGLGGAYVTGVEGDPHNVVGISLPLLRQMLTDAGVVWHELWRPHPVR